LSEARVANAATERVLPSMNPRARTATPLRFCVALALIFSAVSARAETVGTPKVGTQITSAPAPAPQVKDADDPLVDASVVVPGLIVRLGYATQANLAKRALYPPDAKCLLRKSIAERLIPVAKHFAARGQRLVAWDCTRPHAAQEALWKAYPHPGAVADPKKGSLHERGVAIDVALADADGNPVPLPTPFDTFGVRAHADAPMADGPAKENRDQLIAAMNAAGFRPNPKEWWHYSRLYGFRWPPVRDEQLWPNPATP
jgi:D-alanyl-D-alanine dipeptidase